jgi:DNA-binding transcriptional ArsR family regulator
MAHQLESKRDRGNKGVDTVIRPGVFCEVYGDNIPNRVLEFLLEGQSLDSAVGDIARWTGISRPTAYEVIYDFMRKGIVIKSRIIGKTQLYKLNKENPRVQLYLADFKECLRMVCDEYDEKGSHRPAQRIKPEVLKAQ